MKANENMFFEQVHLLTGSSDIPNINVRIHPKYRALLREGEKNFTLPLKESAKLVHDILSRKAEYEGVNLDKWGRFDHNRSLLVQNGLDQSPIIDELIIDIIKQLGLKQRPIWPEGKKAAVCLTHDVDLFDGRSSLVLRKMWWRYHAYSALIKDSKNTCKEYRDKIKRWGNPGYDPIYAFDKWMKLEDKYGFRSTFFFFGLKHAVSREGRLYSYRDPRVRKTVKQLDRGGWEIGLHAGYYHHLNSNYLKKQKGYLEDALEKEVIGGRHHFLRVRYPMSWRLYENVGFKYSSNMAWGGGFNGFRAGTCLPYKPISGGDLVEVPFQLADSATIKNPYSYFSLFADYLQKIKKVGGCLVIDFHQEYFDEAESPGTNKTYRLILDTISKDQELWVAPLRDVYSQIRWPTKDSEMSSTLLGIQQ